MISYALLKFECSLPRVAVRGSGVELDGGVQTPPPPTRSPASSTGQARVNYQSYDNQ